MKTQQISFFCFKGMPNNYAKIDNYVSRSAQPNKEDFLWLKEQGVTDIINFRTMIESVFNFNEKKVVKNLGMKYHHISTVTSKPSEEKINQFLSLVENIKNNDGKAHIHCKAGADRTGLYSFIYKVVKGIGTIAENEREWIEKGHDIVRFPDLRKWAKECLKTLK